MKRFLIPALAVAAGSIAVNSLFSTPQAYAAAPTGHKVAICHGTASDKNPYVLIIVDESAKPAHLAGHGQNSHPDFILNEGKILTAQQEKSFRSMDDRTACGLPSSS